MALSGKGEDHTEVGLLFEKELQCLATEGQWFYHGGLKKMIFVKVGRISFCIDQPERMALFQCGSYNGKYLAFWGHAAWVDDTLKDNHLPSCVQCQSNRVKKQEQHQNTATDNKSKPILDQDKCASGKCSNWDVFDPSFDFAAPANYPTECDKASEAPEEVVSQPMLPFPPEYRTLIQQHKQNKCKRATSTMDQKTYKIKIQ